MTVIYYVRNFNFFADVMADCMKIENTNIGYNKQNIDNSRGRQLADEMIFFADKNSASVSKLEFQEKLEQMENLSAQDLIRFIKGFNKEESVIELICDEIGNSKETRKNACKRVLDALIAKAELLGIDTKPLEKEFLNELNSQFSFLGLYINTKKLDNIINTLTQSIENRQNFTPEDVDRVKNTPVSEGQKQAGEILETRLENAFAAFGERIDENGEFTTKNKDGILYNGQMQKDGWAANTADFVSKIWRSDNTASKVRKDLKYAYEQIKILNEARENGEEDFKLKFKEIFGVDFDYANIVAYKKAEETYINAGLNHELEMNFNRNFKLLLSQAPLREEVETINPDPMTSTVIINVTATKEQVYYREFEKLANILGEQGKEILNNEFKRAGVSEGSLEDKFEILKNVTVKISKILRSNTLKAGKGNEFSEIESIYNNSYKAAFGLENDIMKRVTDYNTSQEIGAGVVKASVTIVASLAAAISGVGLAGVSAITAGVSFAADVSDSFTSGKALEILSGNGLSEYIKTAGKDTDWAAILKQAVVSGGTVFIGNAVAKGVTFVTEGAKPVSQALAMFGADITVDAGTEFLTTGKITIEGMVFSVLLSAAGNIVAIKPILNEAKSAKSQLQASASINTKLNDRILNAASRARYDETIVAEMIQKYPHVVKKLSSYKAPDNTKLFSAKDISDILYNCRNTIQNNPEKIFAILNNPEEIKMIAKYKFRASGLEKAVNKTPEISTASLALNDIEIDNSITAALREKAIKAAKEAGYDEDVIMDLIEKYPEVIEKMASPKIPDSSNIPDKNINDLLSHFKGQRKFAREEILALLNSL